MKGFHKGNLIIIVTVSLIILLTTLACASTMVEPGRFIFTLEPGSKGNGAIKVTNTGEEEMEFRAVLYDWSLDDYDELLIFDGDTRPDSLDGMIKFNPRQFTLKPGDSQMVRFTVTNLEENTDIERKGIVFFENNQDVEENQIGAKVVTQVGTCIYVIPTTAELLFRLVDATVYFPEEGDPLGAMLITNEGKVHVRYKIAYKIVNSKGAFLEEGTVAEKVVLPGFRRIVTFPIKTKFTPGSYNLLLEFSFYGTDQTLSKTIPFEYKPRT